MRSTRTKRHEPSVVSGARHYGVFVGATGPLPPAFGKLDEVGVEGDFEAALVAGGAHGLEPLGHALGVTVFAPLADLGASGDRVPGPVGPFDGGGGGHGSGSLRFKICYKYLSSHHTCFMLTQFVVVGNGLAFLLPVRSDLMVPYL
jgi:hypothetical protein